MTTDPYRQLKTDIYTIARDLLVCDMADPELPYRLIFWGGAISRDEAERRVDARRASGMNYQIWANPSTATPGTVSVIQTDDKDAKHTVAHGLFSACYRVITPAQAMAEEDQKRSVFPWRLMCRNRPPALAEFDHIVESSARTIAYHTGYRPDCPRWAPDIGWLGTIYAIHVGDEVSAMLLKTAIGDCDLEGPGAA